MMRDDASGGPEGTPRRWWPLALAMAACAPGERLGVVEQGACVCPELDAGPDAGAIDAGPPDAAPHQRTRLHYLADSVPVVGASSTGTRAVTLIGLTYPGQYTPQAVGGRSLNFYAYDAARRSTVAHVIAVGPPNGPLPLASDAWIALGYNDWAGAVWTAAEYGAAYDDLVTRLLAELGPGGRVYCQTSTSLATNANARGETLAQFDAATATACARPGAYVVPGSLVGLTAEDRLDVAHLRDSGHAKLAAFTAAMGGW